MHITTFNAKKQELIEKSASIGDATLVWETVIKTLGQNLNQDSYKEMLVNVQPQGRYIARAPRKAGAMKPKVSIMAKAETVNLDGEEAYTRPNGGKYFARKWGEHGDVATLIKAREATAKASATAIGSPMFPLLYGAPGCGKTALVEAAFGAETHTVMGTGDTEVSDFIGNYIQTPTGGFEWVDGAFVKAVERGEVLFIDEVGLIDPKVLSIVYAAMDGRTEIVITANPERGAVKIHPNFFVVAATNPNAPGVRLSEALLSRFTLQVEMTTDWGLAKKLGVPQFLITAATNLSKKQDSGEVSWSPQMRELLAFRDVEASFGRMFAIQNLLACSPELDRPVVADIISRVAGEECKPAKI
jgi:hypothetical protein